MELNEAIEIVKHQLEKKRFDHTLRVLETAQELAERFDAPLEKVELAAVFHDYAKQHPPEELRREIISSDLPKDLLDHHSELWHGPVGAIFAEREYGIIDKEILGAIRCHTTGKSHMNQIELIIYLADYIEPGRSFPGLDEARKAAKQDLLYACWIVSRNTISYLLNKGVTIYPDSIHAYNDLTRKIKTEGMLNEQ